MGEFARILRICKLSRVSLQLLQTMSIMIQNLRNEHSICKLISIVVYVCYGCNVNHLICVHVLWRLYFQQWAHQLLDNLPIWFSNWWDAIVLHILSTVCILSWIINYVTYFSCLWLLLCTDLLDSRLMKGNKWKVEQEYNFLACGYRKCTHLFSFYCTHTNYAVLFFLVLFFGH
jgi:hypothetical protein